MHRGKNVNVGASGFQACAVIILQKACVYEVGARKLVASRSSRAGATKQPSRVDYSRGYNPRIIAHSTLVMHAAGLTGGVWQDEEKKNKCRRPLRRADGKGLRLALLPGLARGRGGGEPSEIGVERWERAAADGFEMRSRRDRACQLPFSSDGT